MVGDPLWWRTRSCLSYSQPLHCQSVSQSVTQRRFFLCFADRSLDRDRDLFFRRLLLRSSSELDRDRFRRFFFFDDGGGGGDRDRELLELRRDRFDFFLRLLRADEER